MSLSILGIGTSVPTTTIDQDDAAAIATSLCCRTAEHRTWLPLMYQQTGIQTRHLHFSEDVVRDVITGTRKSKSCFLPTGRSDDAGPTTGQRMQLYRQLAAKLSQEALEAAFGASEIAIESITHLVTVSCTGFHAPGFDLELMQAIPLRPNLARTHIGFMGCHGALNALRVARAFVDSDRSARIAVCATEFCSLHYHFGWNPGKMIANALFGDGSAALIGTNAEDRRRSKWNVVANSSYVVPETSEVMTWSIADHGFEMTLSKEVPNLIRRHVQPWLSGWLKTHELLISDVGSWAIHPGGPRILDAVEEGLSLDENKMSASREVFAQYGNMSSPTTLFILDRLFKCNSRPPCVALAFGPGLTVEAALLNRD